MSARTRKLEVEVVERGPRGGALIWGIVDATTGQWLAEDGTFGSNDVDTRQWFARQSSAESFCDGFAAALHDLSKDRGTE